MNKLLLVICLVFSTAGCVSIPDISTCTSEIYSYQISNIVNVENTVNLCLDDKNVLKQVYFANANNDSLPTTCRSKGTAVYKNAESVTIETGKGYCKNGNMSPSSKLECEIQINSMTCKDLKYGITLEFTR